MPSSKTKDYLTCFPRGKKSTREGNATRFKHFCKWIKKTPDQLVEEYQKARDSNDLDSWKRETANQIIQFYNWLKEQTSERTNEKYSINYCNTVGSAILAFHHQNTTRLEDIMSEFSPTQIPTKEYRFSQADLRKMFFYGDTEEKALLSLAVSLGYGARDFLALECESLQHLVQEAKDRNLEIIGFIAEGRTKTSIQPHSFLTPEAIQSTEEYLTLLAKKHGQLPKFIWCNSHTDKHITNEGLNKKLRRLVKKANIKTYDKQVRFHSIRKFTYSALRKTDQQISKIIVGKTVSVSDMTYVNIEAECYRVFKETYRHISLNGDVTGKTRQKQTEEIQALTNAIGSLQTELQALRTREQVALQRLEKLETQFVNIDIKKAVQLVEAFEQILERIKEEHPDAYNQALKETAKNRQ